MTVSALIVAAGKGERLGGGLPKQYRSLGGKPVLRWAVEAILRHPRVDEVQVVIAEGQESLAQQALEGLRVGGYIRGGDTRDRSVRNGLDAVASPSVLVHDAARPFCPPAVVDRLLRALPDYQGAVPVVPVADTLARAGELLEQPIDRTGAVRVQTPQVFDTAALVAAYQVWQGPPPTDEASVVRAAGMTVAAVPGDALLDKITSEADWVRAEQLLQARLVVRTGLGFDVHAFGGAGPMMLGGICVPHERGLHGHSDADVVLHAITDALLGAAALGDIGEHFPPSNLKWKDASSDRFLRHAAELIRTAGGLVDQVDCTVICEAPRIGPYRAAMRSRIAEILGIGDGQVSVKATTTERLGFTGRGEGIAAQAIATIRLPQ